MLRGNTVMKGYLKNPAATERGIPRRLVPHRRPRRAPPGRLHRGQGPLQGHHHLGRREHLLARGGGVLYRHPAVMEAAVVAMPTRNGARRPAPSSPSSRAPRPTRPRSSLGAASTSPASRCRAGRLRAAAEDLDRQDPEIRAARARATIASHPRSGPRRARAHAGTCGDSSPSFTVQVGLGAGWAHSYKSVRRG